MPKVSIRVHIFSYIFLLVLLLVILFSGLQYYFSKQLSLEATQKSFHLISRNIALEIKRQEVLAKEVLYQLQNYPEITHPAGKKLNMKLIKRYVYTLERLKNVVSLYSVDKDGNFIEVLKTELFGDRDHTFKRPEKTKWVVVTVQGKEKKRVKKRYYFDEDLKLIATEKEQSSYAPTSRSWYKKALESTQVIRGKPYLFETLKVMGITYSKRVDGTSTVLGLDLSLDNVNRSLKKLKFSDSSELLLFGSDGEVIASTRSVNSYDSALIKNFLKRPQKHAMNLPLKDQSRYAMVSRISSGGGYDTYLAVSVLKREMLQPYIDKMIIALLAVFVLFIISIPFTYLVTSFIIRPINMVMEENKKIQQRDFENVVEVHSNIIELNRLSHSLLEMSKSIHAYQVAQKALMDSFIKLIADAIDAKSPYTGGHCKRVPIIATMLVEEASRSEAEPLKDFAFTTREEMEEFERGAWLHDCGKITTPEYVVDKSTKLETIYNRIHEVRMRFEVLWRDIEIKMLVRLYAGEDEEALQKWKEDEQQKLLDDFEFIAQANLGGEFMSSEDKERVKEIAKRHWIRHFDDRLGLSENELMRYKGVTPVPLPAVEPLLSDRAEHIVERVGFDAEGYRAKGFKLDVPDYLYNYGEVYNLCIEKGTLSEEERFKIQEHVIMSIKMLEQLPYTDDMKRIPEYAGTHHETLIGTGYPRELNAEELSVPARIMAIADIFEALTASDRPYKKGKKLSEALQIMHFMVKDQHIDSDLFTLFLRSGIYMKYAKAHLKAEQIDDVEIEKYLKG